MDRIKKIFFDIAHLVVRKKVLFLGMASGGALLFVPMVVLGGHQLVEAVDSSTFCTQICHDVHYAEAVTYKVSPHSEVPCSECHVGAGPNNMVRSKLGGLKDIIPTITGSYDRPILTPIDSLRPSTDTCEKCHWSVKYSGDQPQIKTTYDTDASNTKSTYTLVLKVDGGKEEVASGIHWHSTAKIWYLPLDDQRQKIGWLATADASGNITEYIDLARVNEITPELIQNGKRLMDCVDCHNRVSHLFRSPDELIDSALTDGSLDISLPFLKREAMNALVPQNSSLDQAYAKIAGIKEFYQIFYPEIYQQNTAAINGAITKLNEIAKLTTFPDGLDWNTHADNSVHDKVNAEGQIDWAAVAAQDDSSGCFRCHGNLVKIDNLENTNLNAVLSGLNLDSIIVGARLSMAAPDSSSAASNTNSGGLNPANGVSGHTLLSADCNLCHYTVKSPGATPLAPATPHPVDGLDNCLACHNPSAARPFKTTHPWATNEACGSCHQSAPKTKTFAAEAVKEAKPIPHSLTGLEVCLSCHGPTGASPIKKDHPWATDDTCKACHLSASSVKALPVAVAPQAKLIPHPINGLSSCLSCHGPSGSKPLSATHPWATDATCTTCHAVAPNTKTIASSAALPDAPVIPHPTLGLTYCLACHDAKKQIPMSAGHPWATEDTCTVCHKQGTIPSTTVKVDLPAGPPIPHSLAGIGSCFTCHGGHNWDNTSVCTVCHKSAPAEKPSAPPPPTQPPPTTAPDPAALYSANCASCHGANRQGASASALTSTALAGRTLAQVTTIITSGTSGMPGYSSSYSAAQISALASWLKGSVTVTVPAAPTTLSANAVSPGQVNLTWVDNATDETGIRLERATNTGFTTGLTTFTLAAGVATYSDTTVAGSTTYYFRVFATNASGSSTASNTATVTTPAPTVTVPAAPSSLSATAASATQVNLTWVDNATNDTGMRLERATNTGFTTGLTTFTLAAGATSYSNTTVVGSTTYYFRVFATNSAGSSTASNTATVTTPAAVIDPAALYSASCSGCHGSNRQGGSASALTASALSGRTLAQVTTTITSGTSGMPGYSSSYSAAQISALASWLKGTVPAAPTTLSATAVSAGQVNLTWVDNATDETGLRLERATNTGFTTGLTTFTLAAGVVSYSDTTVAGSTTYYFRVYATNASGSSTASNTATVTTPAPTVTVPAAPSSLSATAASATQVNLTWVDNATNDTGMRLERATNTGFTAGLTTFTLAAGATSYSNTTVVGSTIYYFRVFATNSAGSSTASNTATVTTPAATISAPALYTTYCSGCHGANRQGGSAPSITASDLSSRTVSWVTSRIGSHNNNSSRLTSAEISALANWLKVTP